MRDRIARRVTLAIAATLAPASSSPPSPTASGGRRRRRRSPAGTSTSRRAAPDCRPAVATSSRARRSTPRNARAATAPMARVSRWTSSSAASARSFDMKPHKTVGSFWPYATTLFDFVRRAMPSERAAVAHVGRSLCGLGLRAVPQRDRAAGRYARRRTVSPRSRCPTAAASSARIHRRTPAPNLLPSRDGR